MQDSPSINPYLGPGGWAVSKRPSFLLSDLNRPSAKKSFCQFVINILFHFQSSNFEEGVRLHRFYE